MLLRYRPRLAIVLLALASLLFMQLAVAGYACPGGLKNSASSVHPAELAEMAAMANVGMPCEESVAADDKQPALCHAYCEAEQQSADTYQAPAFISLLDLPSDISVPAAVQDIPVPLGTSVQTPLLRRHTAAPLAVRHCCFRL